VRIGGLATQQVERHLAVKAVSRVPDLVRRFGRDLWLQQRRRRSTLAGGARRLLLLDIGAFIPLIFALVGNFIFVADRLREQSSLPLERLVGEGVVVAHRALDEGAADDTAYEDLNSLTIPVRTRLLAAEDKQQ
jgi:hypothetical protein